MRKKNLELSIQSFLGWKQFMGDECKDYSQLQQIPPISTFLQHVLVEERGTLSETALSKPCLRLAKFQRWKFSAKHAFLFYAPFI